MKSFHFLQILDFLKWNEIALSVTLSNTSINDYMGENAYSVEEYKIGRGEMDDLLILLTSPAISYLL